MHLEKPVKETNEPASSGRQDTLRQWSSALIAAFIGFVVTYAVFASRFGPWGTTYGWLPSSAIAAPFGWIGHCFPWIGEAIAFVWDLLSLLAMFT